MVGDGLDEGDVLESLRLTLPAEAGDPETALDLAAEVKRLLPDPKTKGRFVAGIEFLDLDSPTRERIHRYVFRRIRQAVERGEIEEPAQRIPFSKPISIRFELFKDFVNEVSANLSTTGMFIRTSRPRPVGSNFDFKFEMGEDFTLIEGRGKVVWVREKRKGPEQPPGMGVRFEQLDSASENVVRRMVEDYVSSGFTPFDLSAEMPSDLPLGDADGAAAAEEEGAAVADLEEVAGPAPDPGLRSLGAEIDGDARSEQLERELTSTAAEREQLSRRLRTTQEDKEAVERELAALGAEMESARANLQGKIDALEEKLSTAAATEIEQRTRIERLQEEVKTASAPAEDLAAARSREEEDSQAPIDELEGLSADTSPETVQLRSRVEQLEKENERQQRELASELAEREKLGREADEARGEIERLEGELARQREQLEERTRSEEALRQRHEASDAEVVELRDLVAQLERFGLERQKELDAQVSEHLGLIRAAEERSRRSEELEARIAELEAESSGEEASALRERFGAGEAAAEEARSEKERLAELLEERNGELEELRTERQELRSALAQQEEEREALQGRLDELEAEPDRKTVNEPDQRAGELAEQLEKQQQAFEELRHEAETASEREKTAAARIDELESEVAAARRIAAEQLAARGDEGVELGPPFAEPEPARRLRPVQFAAGLLLGALALFVWQRAGMPLPGAGETAREGAPIALAAAPEVGTAAEDGGEEPGAGSQGPAADRENPDDAPGADVAAEIDGSEADSGAISEGDSGTAPPDPAAIDEAVDDWAEAWSDQRVADYLSAYAPDFQPDDGLSREEWEAQRRDLVSRPASLDIRLGPLTRERLSDGRYRVSFRQSYESPTYAGEVDKVLELAWVDGAWKIVRETSG